MDTTNQTPNQAPEQLTTAQQDNTQPQTTIASPPQAKDSATTPPDPVKPQNTPLKPFQKASPSRPAQVRNRGPRRLGLFRQCVEIQELLMRDIKDGNTTPAARAQLARAFDVLSDRRRVLKNIPAPKPMEVPRKVTTAKVKASQAE